MKIETRENFKEAFKKVFGKEIPERCLLEETPKYIKKKKFVLGFDFFIILNESLLVVDKNESADKVMALASANACGSNTLSYSHIYEVFEGDSIEKIETIKEHKERIEAELNNRFGTLGEVSVFFNVNLNPQT